VAVTAGASRAGISDAGEIAEAIANAERQLRRIHGADLRTTTDDELCAVLNAAESLARLLASTQVVGAAEAAHRSRSELGTDGLSQRHGQVKPAPFLERILRISGAEAGRRIHLGTALRGDTALSGEILEPRFPELAEAVAAGEVGVEAASTIVRALDAARRTASIENLTIAESGLVEHARRNPVEQVADLARAIRDRLDPDGVLPREEETRIRRGIQLGRERNGIVPISGGLAPTSAALLKSAFDEANAPGAQPRFLSDQDRIAGTQTGTDDDGNEITTLRDTRTRPQRQHDVLDGLLKAGIRNTGLENGQLRSTAEITAHVSLKDLEAHTGVGYVEGISEPVSINTIERLLCDAVFRKTVLGNDGETLALGKAQYPFTSAQKKAIVARDGDTCVLDCDIPASWSDVHHVVEFNANGARGKTNVDNGVMLCGPHHDFVHHSDWQLSMMNGIPHVLAPPGFDPSQTWRRIGRPRPPLASGTDLAAALPFVSLER
jgi:hypothetical protein